MIALLVAASLLAPVEPTPDPTYTLVAWQINTPDFQPGGNVFGAPQTNPVHMLTDSTDLNQIKSSVPCGHHYQIDLYLNSERTDALITGGILRGPGKPDEHFPPGMSPGQKWITSWYAGDCVTKPEPRPWSEQTDRFTCEFVTEYRAQGFYDLSFDSVANTWTENAEPTLVTETSSKRPTTEEERAGRCELSTTETSPEVLAETGPDDTINVLIGWTVMLLIAGVGATIAAVALNRKEEK